MRQVAAAAETQTLARLVALQMTSETPTLQERLHQLGQLRELLERCGLHVAPTRIAAYQKTFARFVGLIGQRRLEREEFAEYLFVLREVDELLWVYKGLRTSVPDGAPEKLEIALGGQRLSREDLNAAARNHQFELRIASYFLQAGFDVRMADGADVTLAVDGAPVHIECKRPESAQKVRAR